MVMTYPHLIMLYGRISDNHHEKQQAMIDGGSTCGYRPYAQKFGKIIYLTPQKTKEKWDASMTVGEAVDYIKKHPESIVWSVKHDPKKDEQILSRVTNRKVYYSCCSYNIINNGCDISLVDTPARIKGNGRLWVKGKDPEYWYPVRKLKLVDYLMIGKRGDKNEVYFINELTRGVRAERKILWIGGQKHHKRIKNTHHKVVATPFYPMEKVRDLTGMAKIGIILSEIPAEGFPQTFLEMIMCGVNPIYLKNAPMNDIYKEHMNILFDKKSVVEMAEECLKRWNQNTPEKVRKEAVSEFSLEKSYESILRGLNEA